MVQTVRALLRRDEGDRADREGLVATVLRALATAALSVEADPVLADLEEVGLDQMDSVRAAFPQVA